MEALPKLSEETRRMSKEKPWSYEQMLPCSEREEMYEEELEKMTPMKRLLERMGPMKRMLQRMGPMLLMRR